MDQVRTLNFMNNAAFLSLGKEYLNLEEKLHWTCMLLFLCNIHKSLTFSSRFQRQKIVFADSLFSPCWWLRAAWVLQISSGLSQHLVLSIPSPLCCCRGWLCCWPARVGRGRAQVTPRWEAAGPTNTSLTEPGPIFLLGRSVVQAAVCNNLTCSY